MTYQAIAATRDLAPKSTAVGAYVTALPPADLTKIPAHVAALIHAGADELHLYHLGLANRGQLEALGAVVNSVDSESRIDRMRRQQTRTR